MEGDAWVRHCPKCAQNVYNLSAMTAGEAERLLNVHEGQVCTKLYRRTDGSVLTQRCPSSVRKIWGRALRLAAAVGFAAPAFGHDGCPRGSADARVKERGDDDPPLRVTVSDASGARIPGAGLKLASNTDEWNREEVTNESGEYVFSFLSQGTYQLSAEADGFMSYPNVSLEIEPAKTTQVAIGLEIGSVGGPVFSEPRAPTPLRMTGRFFRWIGRAF